MSGVEKLIRMANQIAKNFEIRGEEIATQEAATHIKKFWDPRMRSAINAHLDEGGDGLSNIAKGALRRLRNE